MTTLWGENLQLRLQQTLNSEISTNTISLKSLASALEETIIILKDLSIQYQKIIQYSNQEIAFDHAIENLEKLEYLLKISRNMETENDMLQKDFQFLYKGMKTDWETILKALIWTSDFKKLNSQYQFSNTFIEKICSDRSSIEYSFETLGGVKRVREEIQIEWNWYISLFDTKREFIEAEISQVMSRIEKCLNNLAALEEWIDFRNSREQCNAYGLTDYIHAIEKIKLDSSLILPAFLKRFYRLWLDAIMPKYPAVYSFRRRTQDHTVKQFSQLDKL